MIKVNGTNIKDIRYNGLPVSKVMKNGQVLYQKAQDNLISTIILNQNLTDPATMISGDVNGPAIQWIRANSHNYLVKKTGEGAVAVCQLDDSTREKYYDGSAAVLTGAEGDVMMKLPNFAYKSVEAEPDIWHISFAQKPVDDTWKTWEGNDMIGCYEGFVDTDKLYSRNGVISSYGISFNEYKLFANNRGYGYGINKWKCHNIMSFLFYAFYGHMNSRYKIGKGIRTADKINGLTDSLGMTDTTGDGGNGDNGSINFWGLENWWGNKYEHIDDISSSVPSSISIFHITEDDGSIRDIESIEPSSSYIYPQKMIIGPYLDLIIKEGGASIDTGYCSTCFIKKGTFKVARSNNYDFGDVSGFNASIIPSDKNSGPTSRLFFKGEITEMQNVEEFKSIQLQ